jgi:CDP-glycerol glycerophosphotransferase
MTFEVVVLAAGLGTRLGRPHPKPLTMLGSGRSIIRHQVDSLREYFGPDLRITVVVGFKMDLLIEANPDVGFVYNEIYDSTNTSKSLLKALALTGSGAVLWLNGDVVFDPRLLTLVEKAIAEDQSFVCVNTDSVADEEVKYTVGADGGIDALSKTVPDPLGEAVGINFVSVDDKAPLRYWLEHCDEQDYFERGIELAVAEGGVRFVPVDISAYPCIEVDFQADLDRANSIGVPSGDTPR